MENYTPNVVEIPKELDVEDNSLLGSINAAFELTYDYKNHIMACSEVFAILSHCDKGKITLELNALNIHKKKFKGSGPNRDKMCFFGIRQKVEEEFAGQVIRPIGMGLMGLLGRLN